MRRFKDVSNRPVSFTYLLGRRDDVSTWSATFRPRKDLTETSLQRDMPGGYRVFISNVILYSVLVYFISIFPKFFKNISEVILNI